MTYRSKLLINFTLLFAVFTALLVVFQYNREKQYKRELLEARLKSYADMVATGVSDDRAAADTVALQYVRHLFPHELRLTVIDRAGNVKYESTAHDVASMDNHLSRPEVKAALNRQEGVDIRFSETEKQEYFYFAKAYGNTVVRVALPYDDTVRGLMKADNVFLWFVLMLFPVVVVSLLYLSDRMGKAVTSLRTFMQSADKGLVDYDAITFPHSELGDLGRSIMEKYKQLESFSKQMNTERERLMRHFHYFEEGIAIFTTERTPVYANPRFSQYANVMLERPTADLRLLWGSKAFKPVTDFLNLHHDVKHLPEDTPVFRYNATAGGSTFSVQVLIYTDGTFELSLSDVTRTEKARKLKQQMSNNITHELRTPVSSIRGYIETIQENPSLSDERKHYFLEKAHAQLVRLTDLIRDVALITKTEEAADLMQREQVSITKVVADAYEDLHEHFSAEEMHLTLSLPDDLTVHGNYSLLYSIFRNLMENSLRYAGYGREIHLSCYNATQDLAYFSYYDNGPGVPDEHLSRLFERFYRVTEGRTRDAGGTGLGLSIVRNAVLFHHGDISVKNRPEGGLEFLFTLHV